MKNKKSIKKICLFFLVLTICLMGCTDDKTPWLLDSEYSMYLTISATNYKAMTGNDSADTVDALRIYKIRQKHGDIYSLSKLFTKELVYETKDRKFIKKFFLSAQEQIMHVNCDREQDQETFHVVAFDNTFMRAGYFLFNVCKTNENEFGIIQSYQGGSGSSIYYNKPLLAIFKKDIHLIQKDK